MLGEYAEVHRANAAYQQNAERDRDAASEVISKSCFNADLATFSKCVTDRIGTYYNQQATNQDLQAQQDMAYWAKTIFFLGIAQLAFSGFGIYFIWNTLEHNRIANGLTIKAINQERINAKRQLRAYVHLTTFIAQWNVDRTKLEWHFIFQNFGQTPAKKVRVFVSGGMWPTEGYEARFNLPPLDTGGPSESIAPSQQRELHGNVEESLTDEQASLVNGKTAIILVWGRIEYFDIFSMKRTTYFRRMLTVIPEKSVIGFSPPMSGQVNFSICPSPDEDT